MPCIDFRIFPFKNEDLKHLYRLRDFNSESKKFSMDAYDISFNLAGLNPATAVIAGQFAADNNAVIYLNGASTGITSPTLGFSSFTPFTVSSGFLPGLNTLEFQVTNFADVAPFGGPTGLQVNFTRKTADPVPEPASLLLFGFGLVGLAGVRRFK